MDIDNREYFVLFLTSFILVAFLTPLMRRVAISKDFLDRPDSPHKSHIKSVPYLGGVAIIFGIVFTTYATSLISDFTHNTFWLATSVLVPAIILGIIGLIDDIRELSPWSRFVAQNLVAVFTVSILVITNNFGSPTGSKIFDVCISLLWIVGICNSINFFDNLDGGAAGTVAVSSVGLAILSIKSQQTLVTSMSVVILGAMLAFLIWNKNPAKIYMGDAGSLFLGFMIAVLAILLRPQTVNLPSSLVTILLLVMVPILDTCTAIISRLSDGKSPFIGGQDHLSHRLRIIGCSKNLITVILWGLSSIFLIPAMVMNNTDSVFLTNTLIIIVLTFFVILLLLFLRVDSGKKFSEERELNS